MRESFTEPAYAKVNLCLFLGPTRADGRHELVTVFDSIGLADELTVSVAGPGASEDRVICAGVEGPNLVGDALAALREAGWAAPALTVTIDKRIPVAAGLGGGSADAAAMLRRAPSLGAIGPEAIAAVAAALGADVPSQVAPGVSLGTGAGEIIEPLPELADYGVLVLPQAFALSTPAVFREADRLGLGRSREELAGLRSRLAAAVGGMPGELVVNDLQPAALSLRPEIAGALEHATGVGADQTLVCGSGPTVIGLFWGPDGRPRAAGAARELQAAYPGAEGTGPVGSAQSSLPT